MELEQPLGGSKPSQSSSSEPGLSYFAKFKFWLLARLIQASVVIRLAIRPKNALHEPTYTKEYSIRPGMKVRVFVPPSYKSGQSTRPPLYLDVHGGGFTIGDPRLDDQDNAILSRKHGFCVVSIPYRLAPSYSFPTQGEDVAAIAEAVLDDEDIPGDRNKVAIGGYSAGGNLSLTAVQQRKLYTRIHAVCAYYPVTNYDLTLEEKLSTSKLAPGLKIDMLATLGPIFNWAYLPLGVNKRDPLLSPHFADPSTLPSKLCFLGCEYDLLCEEARQMALKFAGLLDKEAKEEKMEDGGWQKGNVRWIHIPGTTHGFNQTVEKDPKKAAFNATARDKMHDDVAEWLKTKAFA